MYPQRTNSSSAQTLASNNAVFARDWKSGVVELYARVLEDELDISARMSARLAALTGRLVPPRSIFVDRRSDLAVAVVDGVTFRLHRGELVILRSCVECGLGHFASAPLTGRVDLGHALSAWEPRHAGCQEEDPINWLESE